MNRKSRSCISLSTNVRLVLCATLLWISAIAIVDAQSITSFTPPSGPIGTAVTITGTGFSVVPVQNIVLFGGVRAQVISASSTHLIVSVPAGTTYEPVSVLTLNGLTAYSSAPFVVTNPDSAPLGATSFSQKVSLPISGDGIVVADLDGDGKLEIISANHLYEGTTISIYKNVSVPGSITTQLAARFVFTRLWYADIAVGDLNGDGRPDIIAAGQTGLIILKNNFLFSLGPDSFSRIDLPPIPCTSIAIGDLDLDGKPELVATSFSAGQRPIILVLKNQIGGDISPASFPHAVSIATSIGSHSGISIRDLDNDQRPDLVWRAKDSQGYVSMCRNNSTRGNLNQDSFGAVSHLAISGTSCHQIAIGDLTHDGIPDLAAAFWRQVQVGNNQWRTYYNVEFFHGQPRNNGELSFSGPTKAPEYESAKGLIRLGDLNGDGNIDLVWGSGDILANISTGDQIIFNRTGTLGTLENYAPPDIAVGDIDGDGAPDIVGPGGVFRNLVSELSIASFSPEFGRTGMSVTINGTHFSPTPSENSVEINGVVANVITSSSNTIIIEIPPGVSSGKLTITVNGRTATSPGDFIVNNIVSFEPESGMIGSTVTIKGVSFDINKLDNLVFFGSEPAIVLNSTDSTIMTTIPAGAFTGPITVTANGVTSLSSAAFTVLTQSGEIVTSTPDLAAEFSVYPIPTNENLFVRSAECQSCDYSVISSVGANLHAPVQHTTEGSTIDVRDLASGLYFLRIQTDRGTEVLKFLKE